MAAKKAIRKSGKSLVKKSTPVTSMTRTSKKSVPSKLETVKKSLPVTQMFSGVLKIGALAPDFLLQDQHGHYLSLSKMRGNKVIVYFYPKDDTPGCTLEAQGFSNDIREFQKRGVMVFGISKDDPQSHQKFVKKYDLKFQLLSDPTTETVKKYGCWVEKSMYGKKYMGIQRATFLIDEMGKVSKVWPAVTPEGHSREILGAL